VMAGCLTEAGETELSKSCSDRMHAVSLDVSKPDSVRRALDKVKALLPPGKGLWGVVNNAGLPGATGPPEWHTIDDYKAVAAVNLYGLIDVTMTFLPLVKMARGRVVNTSSEAGRFSFPFFTPYSVSKYGVEAFTDGLRRSLFPFGVKALLVEPGAHRTAMAARHVIETSLQKSWNQATPEVKTEYGEEFFERCRVVLVDLLMKTVWRDPSGVADAYVHALLGRYPRARYVVGADAKVMMMIQTLPEWFSDWLLRKQVADMPVPAALK